MTVFSQNVLIALLVGVEVFAVSALWPVSQWATRSRNPWALVGALLVIVACLSPNIRLLGHLGGADWFGGHAIDWALIALFIAFPNAVCVASAQSLARAGMPARWARTTGLCVAGIAVLVAPFATLVAGCELLGACY